MTLEVLYLRGLLIFNHIHYPEYGREVLEKTLYYMYPNSPRVFRIEEPYLSIPMHRDLSSVNLSGGCDRSTHPRSDF